MKELRILLFQRALYNYQAVMYLKKEIIISFLIITLSASNLYMPMIWLYVLLLDFLIPFLCDPDLQCGVLLAPWLQREATDYKESIPWNRCLGSLKFINLVSGKLQEDLWFGK
jgi:hypothetical protein